MQKFTLKYKDFVYESLDDKFKDKIGNDYKSLKRSLLVILDNSTDNPDELVNVQNLIDKYIENPSETTLIGFVEDGDIFDLYMKCQGDVDEICLQQKYFDKIPTQNNIFSLYSFIIDGTKIAVKECLTIIQKELFSK